MTSAIQNIKMKKHRQGLKGAYSLVKETDGQVGHSNELKEWTR